MRDSILKIRLDSLDKVVSDKATVDDTSAGAINTTYSASKIEERLSENVPELKTINGQSLLGSGDLTITGTTPTVATGAEVDTGTDNTKMVTPKAMEDSSYTKLALGETSLTAYRGDRGKTAYDHSQATHAPTDADNTYSAINGAGTTHTLGDNSKIGTINENEYIETTTYLDLRDQLKSYFDSIYTPL